MNKNNLLKSLEKVERISKASKIQRMLHQPISYILAIFFKEFIYPYTKKGIEVNTRTFFSRNMKVILPAATDIYLTKGKSHDSEIRLARFMINHINEGDSVLDIGAHYGYFSLLLSELTGHRGKVYSFEASPSTFKLLSKNVSRVTNIDAQHNAISNKQEMITFFEFPALYSEYNTSNITQFENERWIKNFKPNEVHVQGITIDQQKINPTFIKIDVEGGEFMVIEGAMETITTHKPLIAMEYLCSERDNQQHKKALQLLVSKGYKSFVITNDGSLEICNDIDLHLKNNRWDSDNIIFKYN